jgi:hypothetical protein
MKLLLFLFLIPFFISAQTVHVEDNKIIYKERVHVEGATAEQLAALAKQAILHLDKKNDPKMVQDKNGMTKVWSAGVIKLTSSDNVSKKVIYIIEINVEKENYQYRIDSIYLVEKEPGHHPTKISSEDLLSKMNSSGQVAASTERQLNEIDMDFQKLIDRIRSDMVKS